MNYDLSKVHYNKNDKICVICHKKDKNGIERELPLPKVRGFLFQR